MEESRADYKARREKRDRDREINKYRGKCFFNITQTKTYNNQSRKNKLIYIQESFKRLLSLYIQFVLPNFSLC